ncbi:MAG: hypothetical protein J6Y82_04935 [Bacteroidales bacterium]|nr:hypothetical protein [Bacteroidales bacterium]
MSEWEQYADDKYVAIAAECLYGETQSSGDKNPFAVYQKHQERTHRFSFALYAADMSPVAARLLGLMYVDTEIDKSDKYLYKIFVNMPDSLLSDTAMTFANAKVVTPLANIPKPEVKSGNRAVHLSWNNAYLYDTYTSYIIERSTNKDNGFEQQSESNAISTIADGSESNYVYYTDSLYDNNTTYYYRVRGVDCFGRISEPSEVVEGRGALPLVSPPVISNYEVIGNKQVVLNWAFPDSVSKSSIAGFRVYRQSSPNGRTKLIYDGKNPNERSYTDMLPDITNYYRMSAYNTDKEVLTPMYTYVELVDSIAPEIPSGLVGTVDTTGLATVRWNPNRERDLAGYRVYSLNRPDGEFVLQTPSIQRDTVFSQKINLNTLTSMIYYQVRAVDVRDNTSDASATLALVRPDTIPPVAPIFRTVGSEKKYHKLEWIPSSSVDVARQEVLRRKKRETEFEVINVINNSDEAVFVDKNALETEDYFYAIRAVDMSGNSTVSATVLARAAQPLTLKLKHKIVSDVKKSTIEWSITTTPQPIDHYILYKEVEETGLQPYIVTDEMSFVDTEVSMGRKYRYGVKAVFEDMTESELIVFE